MTAPTELTAEALAESGAAPVDVDVNALLAQMQKLQERVDSMSAAAGVPSDPMAAAVKDIRDHVTARKNSHPTVDMSELENTLKDFPDAPSKDDTELLRTVLDECGDFEGLPYIRNLARKLHKMVLKG